MFKIIKIFYMLLNAKERYVKVRDLKNVMKVYLIPTHSEFNLSDA